MSRGTRSLVWVAAAFTSVIARAETVSFQNGANNYAGAVDYRISDTGTWMDGAISQSYGIDGRTSSDTEVDRFGLLRFNAIFGDQPGQIPPNVTILSAQLQLTTATTTDAQSVGPIGVARLLKPFDATTRWNSFGAEGPDMAGGDFARPGNGYEGMAQGSVQIADVTSIVREWANGEPNHGVVIIGATTDAWGICTTGNSDPSLRPKLTVEYVSLRSRAIIFQEGLDGYAGTSMLRLGSTGQTAFGSIYTTGAYLDSDDGTFGVTDALIKFDNIFGAGLKQVGPDAVILKAYLTLATLHNASGGGGSYEARSRGRYDAHRMLVDADWAGSDPSKPFLWGDFVNADGPTEADGEIGPTLSSSEGMAWDARGWFDVTGTVQAWQNGEPNYGLIVAPGTTDDHLGVNPPATTADGWKIHWLGSANADLHPQLVVLVVSARADITGDGYVNDADMSEFERCAAASGPAIPYAGGCVQVDLDGDTDVDQADYGIIQACFSGTQVASSDCR